MKRRTFLGVDLSPQGFRAVALRRHGRDVDLVGARTLHHVPSVVRFSMLEPNLVDRFRFVSQLREILAPLADREERIALSLPDRVGRMLLTEVETGFKTRQEGLEILKWQLKGSLPDEPRHTRIDFQNLGQTESGSHRFLVAVMRADILKEYEDAIEEAGFGAAHIDFHSMNLYAHYRSRFNLDEALVLVGLEGDSFSLHYFLQGQLVYARSKVVGNQSQGLFQELSRTLVSAGGSFPAMRKASVFLHTDSDDLETVRSTVEGCFDKSIHNLDPQKYSGLELRNAKPQALVAALGAAERLM